MPQKPTRLLSQLSDAQYPFQPEHASDCQPRQTLQGLKTLTHSPFNLAFLAMLVIYKDGDWQTIESPQDLTEAWELVERLTEETGIPHHVGRI